MEEERERKGGRKKDNQRRFKSQKSPFIGNYFWYQVNFQTEALAVGCSALLSYKVHFKSRPCPKNPLDSGLIFMWHRLNRPWAL